MRSIYRGLLLIAALTGMASIAQAQASRPVVVFAAASLQTVLGKIAADWKATTGKSLTLSYAASSALARQLENGAPADLFASADLAWMDWAQERKLIKSETRRSLLGNELVLITHRDTPLELKIAPNFALAAAVGDSRLATGNPGSVPVGRYAQAALTSLGVWPAVAPRLAGADSVTAALALVARGEAKLGIVYRTDAASEPKVRVIDTFPADSHPPIVYPFAVTAGSTHPDALAFLDYLSSPTAAHIFKAEGFLLPTVGR
jgi:molybdate transport system substrate-binding protein